MNLILMNWMIMNQTLNELNSKLIKHSMNWILNKFNTKLIEY
jgi:hypothetical protein